MKNYLLLLFFFLLPCMVVGQADSLYIQAFPQEFSIRPYFYKKFTMLSTEVRDGENTTYYPNTPVGLGIGIAYKNYALNLAYAPPMFRNKHRGKNKYLDFQYHYYDRKFLFDFYFQDYKGFYTIEDAKNNLYGLFPDIQLIQYGVTGQYVFNNKKFSYRAAFYGNEKQVRSAGSFQVGGGFYYNKLETETTPILDGKDWFRNYQFNISGGYVHTWVFKKDFFATVGFTTGVNFGMENINKRGEKLEITPHVYPRFALGYNGKDRAILVNGILNRMYVTRSGNADIAFDTGRVNVMYVHRFKNTPGILKKIKILNR